MRKGTVVVLENDLGRVAVTTDAIGRIAGRAVTESFGVVDQAGRRFPPKLSRARGNPGVQVREDDRGVALELHVVVDYGVNLAEVTAMVRSRVVYEVERHTGLEVTSIDVHVVGARKSG